MKTLHVNVNNRIAVYSRRNGAVICGNSDYVIKFSFDAEWEAHPTKTARFIYNGIAIDKVFEGDTVAVPLIRNAELAAVGVFAGDLKTTTPALIPCVKSILCEDGLPPDPEPEVYVQIMEILNAYEDATARIDQLAADVADLQYAQNPLAITKFENTVKNAKIGQEITEVTFSWAFNQAPKYVFLCTAEGMNIFSFNGDSKGTTLNGLSVKNNIKWKLKATDKKDKEVTKETSITFLHGVYYGEGAPRDSYDSEFVKGLTADWRTSKKPSITCSPSKEHIYYCLPTWMGTCNFSVGVLPGGFELADTIMFTNEYGYEQSYYIYKSVELLDKTGIVVNIS